MVPSETVSYIFPRISMCPERKSRNQESRSEGKPVIRVAYCFTAFHVRLTLARSLSSLLISLISLLAVVNFPIPYSANALQRQAWALVPRVVWKNRAKLAHLCADMKLFFPRNVFPRSIHLIDSSYKERNNGICDQLKKEQM